MAISSNLNLANQALALLGESTIAALGTSGNKASLLADEFVEQAILETLQMHEWREAIARSNLSQTGATTPPTYNIPADCLRVIVVYDEDDETNPSTFTPTLEWFLEGETIRVNGGPDWIAIRYIKEITIGNAGPLLQQACATRLATKLALPLTGSEERMATMEKLFSKTLSEAVRKDLQESPLGSAIMQRLGRIDDSLISGDLLRRIHGFADAARLEINALTFQASSTAYTAYDGLTREAFESRIAAKIAAALSHPETEKLVALAEKHLREAKTIALQTSALNGRVLAMIQADLVTKDLSDTTMTEIATFADEARKEVLRSLYQSEATVIGSMDTLSVECVDLLTARKIATLLDLPSLEKLEGLFSKKLQEAKARVLQSSALNGRVLAMIQADLVTKDLSDTTMTEIATFADEARKEVLRSLYQSEGTVLGSMDTLSVECVDLLTARKIAAFLDLPSLERFEGLFSKKLQEAKARALQSSALNGRVLAMIQADLVTKDLSDTTMTEIATFPDEARKEVLRSLYQSEGTVLGSMDTLSVECVDLLTARKIATLLDLPSLEKLEGLYSKKLQEAKARALQSSALNGRVLAMIQADLVTKDLSDTTMTEIATFPDEARKEVLRSLYQSEATVIGSMDTLSVECVDLLTARKIAALLDLPSLERFEGLFSKKLQEAKRRALQSSALNGQVLAMIRADLETIDLSDTALTEIATFPDEARKEVLRTGLFSEALEYTTLDSADSDGALAGWNFSHAAPGLAIVEVAEDQYGSTLSDHELINNKIAVDVDPAHIRYIADEALGNLNPTTTAIIDARVAVKIASYLSLESLPALEENYLRRLREARKAALLEADISHQVFSLIGEDLYKTDISHQQIRWFRRLAAEARKEVLRSLYLDESTALADMDIDAQHAVANLHSAKIATHLGLKDRERFIMLAKEKLLQAKRRALQTSALNGQVLAMIRADLETIDLSDFSIQEILEMGEESRKEVLRAARWNDATERATLTQSAATDSTFPYQYALPADCIRILEINGESYESGETIFEVENGYLFTHATTVWIRYIEDAPTSQLGPLIQSAIHARHALKIAAYLSLPSRSEHEDIYRRRLAEARHTNASPRSGDTNTLHRVLNRSTILTAKGRRRNPLRLEDY